jgi:hypothetical protein
MTVDKLILNTPRPCTRAAKASMNIASQQAHFAFLHERSADKFLGNQQNFY